MADRTAIEWTDATWNPIVGCTRVSEGCRHCYAERLAGTRLRHHPSRAGLTRPTPDGPRWTGEVRFNEDALTQPLRWRRPRRIFVCAHGDLFHEAVPDDWIDRAFAVMALAPQHTFQVLTKRPERMRAYVSNDHEDTDLFERIADTGARLVEAGGDTAWSHLAGTDWPLPNVWLGVTVEDQAAADKRIPALLDTPAAKRFVSAEPLLGPVDLKNIDPPSRSMDIMLPLAGLTWTLTPSGSRLTAKHAKVDWVIAGGESGPGARPMHPAWARGLRDQCAESQVPFFFKQWGEWAPEPQPAPPIRDAYFWPYLDDGSVGPVSYAVGKKRAGRLLDGREHLEVPE